ncbi:hypothetical protein PQE72_gp067 [Bacillus phage vB_BanS_Skywalker]|uniref:Uncharacterized protein n=1 Tax=Bacillus phage vB_BanS_Skywalker TaxID=2894789 RepID=A0AAE9CES3_9CAUD|nr:hypothetical protein PQE72_gp067 [Bacillus phage vB_BanS_Skywalker]UGO51376.1 hypothetical protein SKYWALKER_219 [Bacillus phage vB_BanS_Skywalker]
MCMNFRLNLNSDKVLEKSFGDAMSISSFIECCECGGFIDDDGYAVEILLDGKVVWDAWKESNSGLYPSDALYHYKELLQLEKAHKGLEIVWYNR